MEKESHKALEILELPKVLQRVARFATFSAGRDLVLGLQPSADRATVVRGLALTAEARHLMAIKPSFSIGDAQDVREAAFQASRGTVLTPDVLLRVRNTLTASRTVRGTLLKLADQLPELARIAQGIVECPALERDIGHAIDDHGEILDRATPRLAQIREQIKLSHGRLLSRLNEILASGSGRQAVQDPIITVREGRYVIPVKADFKGQVRGLVHDTSASGATLFVEPMAVVELNNQWRQWQIEEEKEIERILRHLSGYAGALEAEIAGNVEALAETDLSLAKAKYADSVKAVEPEVRTGDQTPRHAGAGPRLVLCNARHPLLTGDVVPITVGLGDDFDILVITGPNTGGKTVALKTVGLLVLMAQAGLAIPADEGSSLALFDHVLADIGDEQSIEQSLSTFSSHVSNIVEILRLATDRSLVLLDELGAGTDPSEGAALARAILTHLLDKGALTVATTHSNELKAFAHITDRVENASVEFDMETLAPTYRLLVGLPGRSNALAIAARLGVPPEILATARQMLSPGEVQVEQLLARVEAERAETEVRWRELERRQKELEELRRELRARLEDIEEEKANAAEAARQEVLTDLDDLRVQIREMGAELAAKAVGRTQLIDITRAAEAVREEAIKRTARPRYRRKRVAPTELQVAELRPGTTVYVRHLKQNGELLGAPDGRGEVEVQVGAFKALVRVEDLEARRRAPGKTGEPKPITYVPASLTHAAAVSIDLDLRGRRADDVVPAVDQYLNDAYLAGLPFVRLIHGKGTGALRQVVRQQLSGHPLVKAYASAGREEGGEGVTVATLAL